MGKTFNGKILFASSIQPTGAQPLDDRTVVKSLSDLYNAETFGLAIYKGMVVSVTDEQKQYMLIDDKNPTSASSWIPTGSGGSGSDYTAGTNIEITGNIIAAKGYVYNDQINSFAEGVKAIAQGEDSHAEGYSLAFGKFSHAEGAISSDFQLTGFRWEKDSNQIKIALDFIKIGYVLMIKCQGEYLFVKINSIDKDQKICYIDKQIPWDYSNCELYIKEGIAYGFASHVEGSGPIASGKGSHAEGWSSYTVASGDFGSHAEGWSSVASGDTSHAEGERTTASGRASHSEGVDTEANNYVEHAQGQYNISHTSEEEFGSELNTIHSIGIGTYAERKNAQEVMQNGDYYVYGIGGYLGTNINEAKTLQKVINELSNNSGTGGVIECPVTSVNGKTGDVTIDISDIEGLQTQLNTFVTETDINNSIDNISINLVNGGVAKINNGGIKILDAGVEKINIVDKDIYINAGLYRNGSQSIKELTQSPTLTTNNSGSSTSIGGYKIFSQDGNLISQKCNINNNRLITITGNLSVNKTFSVTNAIQYLNFDIGFFDSKKNFVKSLFQAAIKIEKVGDSISKYYCKDKEVDLGNMNSLEWTPFTENQYIHISTTENSRSDSGTFYIGMRINSPNSESPLGQVSCTLNNIPGQKIVYYAVTNYPDPQVTLGTNGLHIYGDNKNYFTAFFDQDGAFKILGRGNTVDIQANS